MKNTMPTKRLRRIRELPRSKISVSFCDEICVTQVGDMWAQHIPLKISFSRRIVGEKGTVRNHLVTHLCDVHLCKVHVMYWNMVIGKPNLTFSQQD